MSGSAGAAATAAAARSLYRQLLRTRRRLPGTQVRSSLKYAAGAAFRARRPQYAAARAAAGPQAADDAAAAWLRDGQAELALWNALADQPEAVRRGLVERRFELPV